MWCVFVWQMSKSIASSVFAYLMKTEKYRSCHENF